MTSGNVKSEDSALFIVRAGIGCRLLCAAFFLAAGVLFSNSFGAVGRIPGGGLPPGFEILESFEASRIQSVAISEKLGGKIDKLYNLLLTVHGSRLQVNTIACPNAAETRKIYESVLARKEHPAFCHTFDRTVVEFVGNDTAVAIVAGFELGYKAKPKHARYRISFEAAGIEQADYMSWNKLFNLFLESSADPENTVYKTRISLLAEKFRFGDEIVLRNLGPSGRKPAYSFKPEPMETTVLAGGDLARYKFGKLPQKSGIPYVSIVGTIGTSESTDSQSDRRPGPDLVAATDYWPSDDLQILGLARKITAGCRTEQERLLALLKWLRPGANIRFAGPVVGSRYGVKKVLSQKFGHCWDFSDCFVTFCRALKIPCRQVGGWVYGQSGHIWAEVYFDNKEWRYVDPTGGGVLGCGIYHIPYLTSEDGEMSILYLSQPAIEFLDY